MKNSQFAPVAIALLFACALPIAAQGPRPGWQEAERTKLLSGVSSIPVFGSPGPIAIFGPTAFPVMVSGEPGKLRAVCAAAGLGKGRVVLFGHNSYISKEAAEDSSLAMLLENVVAWCSAKKGKPVIGLWNSSLGPWLTGQGYQTETLKGALDAKVLNSCNVVIANTQGFIDTKESETLTAYIEKGGGFIAGMTGWALSQTSGGRVTIEEYAANVALRSAGLAWTTESLSGKGPYQVTQNIPVTVNALEAMRAVRTGKIEGAEGSQIADSINLALSVQPANSPLATAIAGLFTSSSSVVPTPEKPVLESDAAARMKLAMECRIAKSLPEPAAHPASVVFPGSVPRNAPRISLTIPVDPAIPGWHGTGLYAAAGEKITITVPASVAGQGANVRIGCHTDTLYHLPKWERAPDISRILPLRESITTLASAFGGLIYIDVPKEKLTAPFEVTIAGAVAAPRFVLGKDTDETWNREQKKLLAPWAEFECNNVVLACPAEAARQVSNPAQLMTYWQSVVAAQDDLASQTASRRNPERIVCDVQISAGYMHSGYPIMVPTSAAAEMVTYDGGSKAPGWGFYHELGHNHQRPAWTPEGTTEVTCNLFSLYIFHHCLGKSDPTDGHTAMALAMREKNIKKHLAIRAPFEAWKSDPFLALISYWQLVDAFGWDALKEVIASYDNPDFGPGPKTEAEKRDQWMVRYSQVVKKNLGPFYDRWGIPVSAGAKAQIESLEAWMPKDF